MPETGLDLLDPLLERRPISGMLSPCKHGQGFAVLLTRVSRSLSKDCRPDTISFARLLKCRGSITNLQQRLRKHARAPAQPIQMNIRVNREFTRYGDSPASH